MRDDKKPPDTESGGPRPIPPTGKPRAATAPPKEVLENVRKRHPDALSALFDYGFDRIFALASRLVGERATAEDIAQEVFLKVHRAAHQLDPNRDPMPWLLTITSNACRDHWRSSKGRPITDVDAVEAEGVPELRTGPHHDPERAVLTTERERFVREAIMQLPDSLRLVVILHDYENLTHDEIAPIVGTSHAAVRKRYSRALASLAESLKDFVNEAR